MTRVKSLNETETPIIVFTCSVGNIHRFYLVEESLSLKLRHM